VASRQIGPSRLDVRLAAVQAIEDLKVLYYLFTCTTRRSVASPDLLMAAGPVMDPAGVSAQLILASYRIGRRVASSSRVQQEEHPEGQNYYGKRLKDDKQLQGGNKVCLGVCACLVIVSDLIN
jgi:hypothetical protein